MSHAHARYARNFGYSIKLSLDNAIGEIRWSKNSIAINVWRTKKIGKVKSFQLKNCIWMIIRVFLCCCALPFTNIRIFTKEWNKEFIIEDYKLTWCNRNRLIIHFKWCFSSFPSLDPYLNLNIDVLLYLSICYYSLCHAF